MTAASDAAPLADGVDAAAVPRGEVAEGAARGSQRPELGTNIAYLAGSQAVTWVLTLAWTLVVPRLLGATEMGVLVTAMAVSAVLGLLLGLPTRDYLARQIVAEPADAPRLLGTALLLRTAMVPVLLAVAVVYGHVTDMSRTARVVLLFCAAATLCSLLAEPAQATFQALERMHYLAYLEVLNKTLQSLGGIALVLLGFGVLSLTAFSLTASALVLALAMAWLRRVQAVTWRVDSRAAGRMLKASAPYWTFGVFYMIYLWIDAIVLSLLAPSSVVGWYGVATRLFTTLMCLPVILSTAWLPRLVSAFGGGSDRLYRTARKPMESVLILSIPVCIGATLAARPAIQLLYGEDYRGAGVPLAVLALCVPPMYLNIIVNQVLVASGRPLVWASVLAGATVLNPALNLALVSAFQRRAGNGAIGAAASLFLTELAIVIVGVVIVGRHVLVPASLKRLGRAGAAGVAMAVAMWLASPLGAFAIVPGLAVFIAVALPLGVLEEDQRRAVGRVLQAVRARMRRVPTP